MIQRIWAMMPQPSDEDQGFFNQTKYGTTEQIDTRGAPVTGYGPLNVLA
jgi:hypothetical protein